MDAMSPPPTVPGRVKACDACRLSKLRCDAHKDNYRSCSRCRKMRRNCVTSTSSRPRNRKTKAELELEVDRLRAQQAASVPIYSPPQPAGHSPEGPQFQTPSRINSSQLLASMAPHESQSSGSLLGSGEILTPSNSYLVPGADALLQRPSELTPYSSETIPRTIGDVQLDARKIDGCISEFFTAYAPSIPGIFDSTVRPNDIFEYSELLFWTIIHVGSRKYSRDPTIIESLTQSLETLIQSSMLEPDDAIPTIQAALLLCLWTLPINTDFKVQTHAIAGAAMQLAIQKGLPFAARKQDFFRAPLRHSEKDHVFRARLWGYCVMIFQSNSVTDGFPHIMTVDPNQFDRDLSHFNDLPAIVTYAYRLHRVMTDSLALVLSSTNLFDDGNDDALNSIICQFDTQAQRVPSADDGDLSRFTLLKVRLLIRAFHFFSIPGSQHTPGILQAYLIACEIINLAVRLDKDHEFGLYCDHMQARVVALAATVILRVLRSNLSSQVNPEKGENLFFEAIRLSKKRSVRIDDLDARNAIILTQLWSSSRAFHFKDGTMDGLRLLLRARLSMSVYFDVLWWWRAEFGCRANPYLDTEHDEGDSSAHQRATTEGRINFDTLMLSDANLPDWNWGEIGDLGLNWY